MTPVVVDASFAIAWFVDEPHRQDAILLREDRYRLLAPELLQVEVGNVLWKKIERKEYRLEDLPGALADLRGFDIAWTSDADLVTHAALIAVGQHHPIYDCLYVALALQEDAQLATADRRLIALAERLAPSVRVWRAPAN